jgi:predicted site-specific integrase-resolvase
MQTSQNDQGEELLASRDVMRIARISRSTLERWIASGRLPVVKIENFRDRRYNKADVLSIINPSSTVVPSPAVDEQASE